MSLGYDSQINLLVNKMSFEQRDRFVVFLEQLKSEGLLVISESYHRKISINDIIESINFTTRYDIRRDLANKAAEKGETTIQVEDWGVHITHCCSKHGCKYGDIDCPVAIELAKQTYPCESCNDGW
jgi:hypothetical protein